MGESREEKKILPLHLSGQEGGRPGQAKCTETAGDLIGSRGPGQFPLLLGRGKKRTRSDWGTGSSRWSGGNGRVRKSVPGLQRNGVGKSSEGLGAEACKRKMEKITGGGKEDEMMGKNLTKKKKKKKNRWQA